MIISLLKGSCRLKAEGRFPERILNIASTSGIYVYDVHREKDKSLLFSVSKKGYEKLIKAEPLELTLTLVESYGIPFFFQRYKKRAALIALPLVFLLTSSFFSLFLWKVEFKGGEKALRSEVQKVLYNYGIHTGALKHKIDQQDIKRKALIEIDELSWLWVDIKGTTATVKIKERTKKPALNEIHEPSDVIAMHSGIIDKMQVYCGQPLFSEGMAVEKGDILVTGVFKSEKENIPVYYHHAAADVFLRLSEQKTVIIPRKNIIKAPTGNKKSVFKINFKKNNVKFSLNSGISYDEYDKIEKTVKIPFTGISFSKIDYCEVLVETEDADTAKEIQNRRKEFLKTLEKRKMEVENLTEKVKDNGDSLSVTFFADCIVRTDKEIPLDTTIPIEKGEADGKNS